MPRVHGAALTMRIDPADPPALPAFLAKELPFARRAVRIGGRRVHYLDEGGGAAPVARAHFLQEEVPDVLAEAIRYVADR